MYISPLSSVYLIKPCSLLNTYSSTITESELLPPSKRVLDWLKTKHFFSLAMLGEAGFYCRGGANAVGTVQEFDSLGRIAQKCGKGYHYTGVAGIGF